VGGTVWIPVGAEDDHAGDGRARVMPRVVLDGAAGKQLVWATNVGILLREKAALNARSAETGTVGNELQLAGALGWLVLDRRMQLGPELALGTVFDDGRLFTQAGTHFEALAAASYQVGGSGLRVGGGLGGGIVRTAGTPDFRALLRVAYAPAPAVETSDDEEPEAIVTPEPVAAVTAEPEPVPPPPAEAAPAEPASEPAPLPPVVPPPAVVEAKPSEPPALGEIEPLYFSVGQTTPKDIAALDRAAELLAAHPELTEIRVDGHSDDVGDAAYNQQLSHRRARQVADVLRAHGVPEDKIQIKAWGATRPAMPGQSAAARMRNRRVEITHTP
jgi:OmpA-OmpF porin, OOP family